MPPASVPPPPKNVFDNFDDDEDGWQDMPIVREDDPNCDLDDDDKRKYHYQPSANVKTAANARGNLIDFDDEGNEWRSKADQNEREYTRLRVREEEDADEVHLRTKYLFDEDKAMTPLSQMQATKNLLTEAQRIAYVGLCSLTSREMLQTLRTTKRKELKAAGENMELWMLKIMGRLYYHMELETQEQKMIESLAEHGVLAMDLVPALMTTHTVANPEYDPEEARRKAEEKEEEQEDEQDDAESISGQTLVNEPGHTGEEAETPTKASTTVDDASETLSQPHKTTQKVLKESSQAVMPGVSTTLSAADKDVTLDIRWTVLCDLFLILIADSVYDARSRVLLENVATKLGLGWLDVVKFESRITEALEIQEDVESLEQQEIVEGVRKAGKKRRYMMLGLATVGGGLVIGLSAGLLAPVIGLGLAGALGTVGVTGTAAFLGGTAGAAVITTGGVLTGSGIAVKGMANRTKELRTFEILPLHNNKRVNCILTVPGFMTGLNDDVRLPFSVLDPIVGDVFSVLWEPDMIRETGSALKILTSEVLSQIGMTVLQATVMTGLMSALQWPIILTKLGYLIDNPWSNALDRAKLAGKVLADVLIQRHLGVRPITLIGFSLGARVIFYALLDLAKRKECGIVQDVFLLGATVTMPLTSWLETRSVVSGRYVNAYARNDWVLNYLFRATAGGVGTVAGLRPVENVPGLENVDVTDKIAGHMSYRTFMPLILDQLGFPVFSDFFDEPVEPDFEGDRVVIREEEEKNKKKGWFSRKKSTPETRHSMTASRPPAAASWANKPPTAAGASQPGVDDSEDLPPRMDAAHTIPAVSTAGTATPPVQGSSSQPDSGRSTPTIRLSPEAQESSDNLPSKHAGFDLAAIKDAVSDVAKSPVGLKEVSVASATSHLSTLSLGNGPTRPQSTPPKSLQTGSSSNRSASFDYRGEAASSTTEFGSDRNPFNRSVSETAQGPSYPSLASSSSSFYTEEPSLRTPRPPASDLPSEALGGWGASVSPPSAFANSSTNPFSSNSNLSSSALGFGTPSLSFGSNFTNGGGVNGATGGSSGLSFGGSDGTITPLPASDPWMAGGGFSLPPPKRKTTADSIAANPWS